MKKTLFIGLCLLGTALTASAQFKLHSNGKMSFKRTESSAPVSPISLMENVNDSTYFITYSGNKNGMFIHANGNAETNGTGISHGGYFKCSATNAETLVGLRGYANFSLVETSNNPGSVGVWGSCFPWAMNRYGYGVLGQATGQFYSAGVCGVSATANSSNAVPDDYYAGLFVGKTKVVGTLTATGGLYNTSLHNCPVVTGRSEAMPTGNDGMTTSLFHGLTSIAYHNPQKAEYEEGPRPTFLDPDPMTLAEMEKMDIDASKLKVEKKDVIEQQIQEKQHYALSADELEKVLPDLVYTDKDGSKAINYVEMVPLLVQCINELNARLSALDGNSAARRESRLSNSARESGLSNSADTRVCPVNAVLYQNTPNPFNAQTEIRFSLPDDAPQAYIYIFDMTGKMQKQIPVDPSQQSVTINGYELQAGIYLYSLVVGGQEIDTKRMILSK